MDDADNVDQLAAELLERLAQNPHETATQTTKQLVAKAYDLATSFAAAAAERRPAEKPAAPAEPQPKKSAPSVSKT